VFTCVVLCRTLAANMTAVPWGEGERRQKWTEHRNEFGGRRAVPALDLRELGPLGDGMALPRERVPMQWHRMPLRAEVLQPAAGYDDITQRAFRRQSLNCCTSATGAVVPFVGEVRMPQACETFRR
jgi:hypothetical protein